jgi:hypothetical protein
MADLSAIAQKAWRYAAQGKRIKELRVNRREWVRRIRGIQVSSVSTFRHQIPVDISTRGP